MVKYILRRLAISLVTIWVIATASFFLLRLLPGNPFTSSQILPADVVDQLMDYYGLNRPIMEQYATFMWNLLHFDFGYSLKYAGQSVNGIIAETFPVSAQLGLQAYFLSLPLGILFGIIAAHKRGKPLDYLLVGFAVLGVSVPVFIIASLLQYVFAIKLQWLPVAQWKSFAYTILPTLTLSFGSIAGRTRTMRTLMLGHLGRLCQDRKGKRTFFSNDHLAAPDPQCNYSADSQSWHGDRQHPDGLVCR